MWVDSPGIGMPNAKVITAKCLSLKVKNAAPKRSPVARDRETVVMMMMSVRLTCSV